MRFLEAVLVLLGCVLHLVFAKAQMATEDGRFLDKTKFEPEAQEAFVDVSEPEEEEEQNAKPDEYLKPEAFLEDVSEPEEEDGKLDEYLKQEAFLADVSEPEEEDGKLENDKHDPLIPRRPQHYPLTLSIGIPPVTDGRPGFKLCLCFRRKKCDVQSWMYPGFKGWKIVNQSGYIIIGKTLYYFYPCKPGLIPPFLPPKPGFTPPKPTTPPKPSGSSMLPPMTELFKG